MNNGQIVKYVASAGAGKTHTLVREYLKYLFINGKYFYQRILAVTFTNKAAAEMKRRILDELSDIASGKQTAILGEIQNINELKDKPEQFFQKTATVLLSTILSDYSKFSVGTIDSFFQKVFRAFAREMNLQTNFNLYVDHGQLLKDAVGELINNVDDHDELRPWLLEYAKFLLDEGRSLKLDKAVLGVSETIFSEQYKLLPEEAKNRLSNLKDTSTVISAIKELMNDYSNQLKKSAGLVVDILDRHNVEDVMLFHGRQGVGPYARRVAKGEIKEPNSYVLSSLNNNNWVSSDKKISKVPVNEALGDGLDKAVQQLVAVYNGGIKRYNSAKLVLKEIYTAAILSDVIRAVRNRSDADNSFILADTGDFLKQIIGNDQTPFIYEKIGNEYDVFMIDEFQDTSVIQYVNFKPLLENSISQGYENLIVGDVKQSIYRFRNGDWTILGKKLDADFSAGRVKDCPLLDNWRSLSEIVKFNNTLFSILPKVLDTRLEDMHPVYNIADDVYKKAIQSAKNKKQGGYVKLVKLVKDKNDPKAKSFKNQALEYLPSIIDECVQDNYSYSDICILVRTKADGMMVLEYLSKYDYPLLTADSLVVGNSNAVRFIVTAMQRIGDNDNDINRAEMLRYYFLAKNLDAQELTFSILEAIEKQNYPDNHKSFLKSLASKPLFEITESIISFFKLNEQGADMAAINFFQDQVLNYMNNNSSDIKGFVDSWYDKGQNAPVILSAEQSAINIMTIHKAKGLEFKVVIMPFISWTFEPKSSTLIWITPENDPFKGLGAVPVQFGSIDKSEFISSYIDERWSSYLDCLNMMYVAFTRARERLYGFFFSSTKNDAGSILEEGLLGTLTPVSGDEYKLVNFSDFYNSEKGVYEQGIKQENVVDKVENNLITTEYRVCVDNSRLRLKLSGSQIIADNSKKEKTRAYYGTVFHDILSHIHTIDDVDMAVASAVREGFLTVDSREETVGKLKKLIDDNSVKKWFEPGLKVLTEAEILSPDGDTRRPDRIIVRGNKVSIIDYKFGEPNKAHERQMAGYYKLLTDMGYEVEEACLWYVDKASIKTIKY